MKKNMALIFVVALILNLLSQTSNAWRLDENNTKLIYNDDDEKEEWEKYYLPHAKYSKLVSRNATVLDIAKMTKKEEQNNSQEETIVHKIQKNTRYVRKKMFLKWERDNGYVDEKLEQKFDITPTIRNKLLKEIREEEEREAKEENQFWWKNFKAKLKIGTAVTAFVVSIFFKRDIFSAAGIATLSAMTVSTITDVVEVKKDMAGDDEEIKLPPLRNLPELPKNYTRVDVYSYGL